jgi:outer membrane protein OmpA-like peptidoglycan-associated protein
MTDTRLTDPRRTPPGGACSILRRRAALLVSFALLGCQAQLRPASSVPTTGEVTHGGSWLPSIAAAGPKTPAIALTASDGTGLRLIELRARAWVQAPLALTELHLVFENPEARTLEGNFEIQLPPRSAISRFGMKIDGLWQEGEVVERQAARRVFEDFLHRRQDPALLEHDAGERFRARVFPIPAHARKELIVTYSQELAGTYADYRLPLAGMPRLDILDVRVLGPHPSDPDQTIELYQTRELMVERPAEVLLHEVGGPPALGLRSGDLAVARLTIPGDQAPDAPPRAVTVLLDTSASQAADFAAKVAHLAALVRRLGEVHGAALPVRVWCFDQEAVEVFRGPAREFSRVHTDAIHRRRALGASDPARALASIRKGVQAGERVVLVGDGVATAGYTSGAAITGAARRLRTAGVTRIDAVLAGGNRDLAALTQLVTADAGANAGVVVDGSLATPAIVEKLRRRTFSDIHIAVPGSRWTWPERLDGVQPGDSVLVYADLPEGHALQVELGGGLTSPQVASQSIERPLLERAWVGARITRLLAMREALPEGDEDMRRAMRDQVVELSRKHRVLSPFTGLLVLESEDDYQRYGIRRDALTDILAIGDAGPVLLHRNGEALRVTSTRRGETLETDPSARPEDAVIHDTDGDAIADGDDRCPTEPENRNGYEDEDGCPDSIPSRIAAFTGSIRGIYFANNSANIKANARPVLDRAISILREFTTIDLEISGHRAPGETAALGQRRAKAVRDYFVAHGIAPGRLTTRDGGEDEPIDTNKTSVGRAKNRRIEFTIRIQNSPWTNAVEPKAAEAPALSGTFAAVMARLPGDPPAALALASAWWDRAPGDVLALLALGEALAAIGDKRGAARAYGSLIDLFPARADMRRHAAQRLATLGAAGLDLAIDSYAKAVEQRPDHLTGHRLYAHALARAGRHSEAFAAILEGLRISSSRRRAGVEAVLRADAGLLAAALVAHTPERRAEVVATLQSRGIGLPETPSTSFVLSWESDANDVDLHVIDGTRARASYSRPTLPSGGELVADVTNGYGPELFTIPGKPQAYPYTLEAHYFGQGPMGYGMGTLQVIEHDGKGQLRVDERPFVIMNAGARVPLGQLRPRP